MKFTTSIIFLLPIASNAWPNEALTRGYNVAPFPTFGMSSGGVLEDEEDKGIYAKHIQPQVEKIAGMMGSKKSDMEEKTEEAKAKAEDLQETARSKSKETGESMRAKTEEMGEQAKESKEAASAKAKEMGAQAQEAGDDVANKAKESGSGTINSAKEWGADTMQQVNEAGASAKQAGADTMNRASEWGADTMNQAKESGAATMNSAKQYAADTMDRAKETGTYAQEAAGEKMNGAKEWASDTAEQAKAAGNNAKEAAGEKINNSKEWAASKAEQAKEVGINAKDGAAEKIDNAKEWAAESAEQAKNAGANAYDRTKEAGANAYDRTKEAGANARDAAKEAGSQAGNEAENLKNRAGETLNNMASTVSEKAGELKEKMMKSTAELYARKGNRRKSDDILAVEKGLVERGFTAIIGSDETGRGSVAGPVLAASCCVLTDWAEYIAIPGVGDSKTLAPEDRYRIYEEVVSKPHLYKWAVAERTNQQIDDSNILMATMECFKESIEAVASKLPDDAVSYSIVDGKKSPKLSIKLPCRPWVKGDAEVYTVSLASIIAKVTLDRLSLQWHDEYPDYGFDVNKGYATKEHVIAIHQYGPCPIHRLSFKSLKGR